MSTNNYYLSFCIPVFNEEKIISSKIIEAQKNLKKILKEKSFEILIVENGSTDNTLRELQKINDKNVRVIKLKDKGHGMAMRTAILQAKAKFVLLTAIDLPFGFSDIEEMLKISNRYAIIFGSKSHAKSITHSPKIRMITSRIYRIFLKLLFGIKIKDTQGTVFLSRELILPLLKNCGANNAFFSAQLAIFSEKEGLQVTEVPVKMEKEILRKSKYNVLNSGSEMLVTMLKTYLNTRITYIKQNTLSQ